MRDRSLKTGHVPLPSAASVCTPALSRATPLVRSQVLVSRTGEIDAFQPRSKINPFTWLGISSSWLPPIYRILDELGSSSTSRMLLGRAHHYPAYPRANARFDTAPSGPVQQSHPACRSIGVAFPAVLAAPRCLKQTTVYCIVMSTPLLPVGAGREFRRE